MEDKTKELLKNTAVGAVFIAMLIIPFPPLVLEVLFALEAAWSVAILVCSLSRKNKGLPKLVLFFTMFALAVNISFTRAALTGFESGVRVSVAEYFAGVLSGNNYVTGFEIALILLVVQIILESKSSQLIVAAARSSLDGMNRKFFDIDNGLSAGRLTESDAEKQKLAVRGDVDYFSCLDGASRFLSGSVKATVIIILVNLLGGIMINLIKQGLPFADSLSSAAKLTTGNIVIFILPVLVVSYALGLSVRKNKN